ncbi:MAG: hypothetical protein ACR2N7_08400 [Acidimicrobiia bacterium]
MRVTLHTSVDTDVSPDLIRRALLDFSDRRPDIWPQLDPKTYKVHSVGETSADVTEGSPFPKVWSREQYDWSHPTKITWTAAESNFCTPGSHVSMDIVPTDSGGCQVAVTWDRTAANMRGRVNLAVIGVGGERLLNWATKKSLADVEKAYLTDN